MCSCERNTSLTTSAPSTFPWVFSVKIHTEFPNTNRQSHPCHPYFLRAAKCPSCCSSARRVFLISCISCCVSHSWWHRQFQDIFFSIVYNNKIRNPTQHSGLFPPSLSILEFCVTKCVLVNKHSPVPFPSLRLSQSSSPAPSSPRQN